MNIYLSFKDNKNKNLYFWKQNNIFLYKFLSYNEKLSVKYRFKIMLKMQKQNYLSLKTKIKNRCINSIKVRSPSRLTNLVKSSFKNNLAEGSINGFRKAS
jgi:ribosomal protein S14